MMEKGRIVGEYTPKEFDRYAGNGTAQQGASDDAPCATHELLPLPNVSERAALIMHDLCKRCGEIEVFTNLSGAFPISAPSLLSPGEMAPEKALWLFSACRAL